MQYRGVAVKVTKLLGIVLDRIYGGHAHIFIPDSICCFPWPKLLLVVLNLTSVTLEPINVFPPLLKGEPI